MKRFLIVNPFGLGDALFSLACAQRIREEQPEAWLGFVGNERTQELLRLCPSLDRVHVFNRDSLRRAWKKSPFAFLSEVKKLTDSVAQERYDTLIDFSLGREFSLAAACLGIRKRIGLNYRGRGFFLTNKKKLSGYEAAPVAQEQLNFLYEAGVLPSASMPDLIPWRIPETAPFFDGPEPFLAVAPGGGKSWGKDALYKQWDEEKFVEVLKALKEAGIFRRVIFLGDESEKELLQRVQKRIPEFESILFAGESMASVAAVLKQAKLLLCNDGGLLHFANALGAGTVSIFGPVDGKVYGPYGGKALRRVLTADVPCRPCYQQFHFPVCIHERQCLTQVSTHKVIEAIKEIL